MKKKTLVEFVVHIAASGVITSLITENVLHKPEFLMYLAVYFVVYLVTNSIYEFAKYIALCIRGNKPELKLNEHLQYLVFIVAVIVLGTVYFFMEKQIKLTILTYVGCLLIITLLIYLIVKFVKKDKKSEQ